MHYVVLQTEHVNINSTNKYEYNCYQDLEIGIFFDGCINCRVRFDINMTENFRICSKRSWGKNGFPGGKVRVNQKFKAAATGNNKQAKSWICVRIQEKT